ncbi:uncharacterized protein Dmoj_GI20295 [Drosophila mojavensis]|uniref:Uncharacterized protein n=1 Tax=Drosophila mojavensis TaxID=7230 RepID=B4KP73_DROMO|nr:uncharacterized protein Dmoj_GI20295 [Drosophila mojavensis]
MWTYMMAAARGDRVNTMMSSRRRPETESPKYGYNLSRPMYRTTRFVSPVASAPAQLGPSSCNPAHEELEHKVSRQRELPFDEVGFAKDNREEAIDLAEQKSTQPRASDANYLENGRKLIQCVEL